MRETRRPRDENHEAHELAALPLEVRPCSESLRDHFSLQIVSRTSRASQTGSLGSVILEQFSCVLTPEISRDGRAQRLQR